MSCPCFLVLVCVSVFMSLCACVAALCVSEHVHVLAVSVIVCSTSLQYSLSLSLSLSLFLPASTRHPCSHGTEDDWQSCRHWWVVRLSLPQSNHWVREPVAMATCWRLHVKGFSSKRAPLQCSYPVLFASHTLLWITICPFKLLFSQ